jgi:hypothetical protein
MAIYPIIGLGATGVNTDHPASSLPPGHISWASNAAFIHDSVARGNVLRLGGPLAVATAPKHLLSYRQQTGTGLYKIVIGNSDGKAYFWSGGLNNSTSIEIDASPTGYIPSVNSNVFTSTVMNGIAYLNRSDRVPWYVATLGDQFAELPFWDPSWSCQSLRSLGAALVAINITKGATNYPTTVKTSDFSVYGSVPQTWTAATNNSATENILTTLAEPLVDGLLLRDSLILYSNHETWIMTPTEDDAIYSYKALYTSYGMISTNCGASVNNRHYVFGASDIWTHDGLNYKSLAIDRVRNFIFDYMVQQERHQFFVCHDDRLKEVYFCYVSNDPKVYYPAQVNGVYLGCNRCASYNYAFDTWAFYDLPYVTSGNIGSATPAPTYESFLTTDYNNITGNYADYNSDGSLVTLMSNMGSGSGIDAVSTAIRSFVRPNYPIPSGIDDAVANAPVTIERTDINLKEIVPENVTYSVLTAVYPDGNFRADSGDMNFYAGATDFIGETPVTYDTPMDFSAATHYKLDFTTQGRYLSLKMTYDSLNDFVLTGYDIEGDVVGRR